MDEGLFSRMNYLNETINSPVSAEYISEYENLDATICKIMQRAEKQCRRVHMDSISWSPQFKKSTLILECWLKKKILFQRIGDKC